MMELCKTETCTGCSACASSCPQDCIAMEPDGEGFLRPVIDADQCVSCGRCRAVCPVLTRKEPNGETTAFAAANLDEEIRRDSTSGGVFTLLCQWVMERGGCVFGAAYDERFNVVHCRADTAEQMAKLRSAKYAQSNLGSTFRKVRDLLEEGRYVLFSGTPCQVGGLRAFLGKDYERLILTDLICHGVPSPEVWRHYVDYRSRTDAPGAKPANINLRSKETGWPGYSVRFDYDNGVGYSARNTQDPYLRCFVGDFCLRPSCYDCRFKGVTRDSDFTLGDYWGVWNQLPEYDDGKGASLVMLHTKKARILWEELRPRLRCRQLDVGKAVEENPAAVRSPDAPPNRKDFWERYRQEDFSALMDELRPVPAPAPKATLLRRAIGKLRRMF